MRKFSNWIIGILAAGVCALITWITRDASKSNVIFNLGFLAVMVLVIIVGWAAGFLRLRQTREGLDRATGTLHDVSMSGQGLSQITGKGVTLFGVNYYDSKYQEYLTYLHKTNSPTDIGDYIGEYEINNYTHRKLLDMIPDILTSLGILGTFVGLVLGLQGFNPTSYEAMSSSVESLIDGIKVAFVTSIYGLSLSLAFSYWLRGELSSVSESLDRFLDTYYTAAVPPNDATAMNHIIANQNAQTKVLQQAQQEGADQIGRTVAQQLQPMAEHLSSTMDSFTTTITCQQETLLQNISKEMARTMKEEFFSEFLQMRKTMGETNKVQQDHVQFMQESEGRYQTIILEGQKRLQEAMDSSAQMMSVMSSAMKVQEENLTKFAEHMEKSMGEIAEVNDTNLKMTKEMEQLSSMNEAVARQMTEVSQLAEQYTRSLAAVQANNSDLSEGLSVMNDANIRMTDQISRMNDQTVKSLKEAQKVQQVYLSAADSYLKAIREAQNTLVAETRNQQENLREFTDYMAQALKRMDQMTADSGEALAQVTQALANMNSDSRIQHEEAVSAQLSELVSLLREQEKRDLARMEQASASKKRRGLFGR